MALRRGGLALLIAFSAALPSAVSALADEEEAPRAAQPPAIDRETRQIVGGSLVFIGHGADLVPEVARFKAQSMAVQGIATECSLPHKEIKIDEFVHERRDGRHIYHVKASLELDSCEEAKRASRPEEIRRLTNPVLAEDQKRYKAMVLGHLPGADAVAPPVVPASASASAPVAGPARREPSRAVASEPLHLSDCTARGRVSCHAMGTLLEGYGDYESSRRYFSRGCALGDSRSCRRMSP